MRTTPLLLAGLLLAALLPLPTAAAQDCPEGAVCGRVPLGSDGALARDLDHHRHPIPPGAVGLVLDGAWATGGVLPATGAKLGRLTTCPPGAACTQVVDEPPCLVAYAGVGDAWAPYGFRWTAEEAEADLLLVELPLVWGPSPPLARHQAEC